MARLLLRELGTGDGGERIDGLGIEVVDGGAAAVLGDSPGALRRLVRALAGLEPVRAGTLLLDGIDVTGISPERRGVAVVFAGGALFPHLDVRGNIEIGLQWRGVAKGERDARVQEIAALLGFETRLGTAVHRLTAADRVRVGLARALVRDPALVVLDDVFADVETGERGALRADAVRALRKCRRTVIFATRDGGEAFALAEQIAFVHRGVCVQVGSHEELSKSPKTLAVARATGALVAEAGVRERRAIVGGIALELPAERADVAVVLPAEAVSLGASGGIELTGSVELVEALPPREVAVSVRVQGQTLSFRVPRTDAPRVGQDVRVQASAEAALFFDPASGERISAQPKAEPWIPPTPPPPEPPAPKDEATSSDGTTPEPEKSVTPSNEAA